MMNPYAGAFLLTLGLLSVGCATARPVAKKQDPPPVTEPAVTPVVDPLALGYELEAAERWSEATVFYAQVLKDQPANAQALHRLAVIATLREDDEAAANYYRRALELDPQNAVLLTDLACFLTFQEQYDSAAQLLQRALELAPNDERTIGQFALVQGLRGEVDLALVLFRRVSPPGVALQQMAAVHEQRAEWQLALSCYLEARSLDATVAIPETVLAKVAEMRRPESPVITAEPTSPPIVEAEVTAPVVVSSPPPSRPVMPAVEPALTVETDPTVVAAEYEPNPVHVIESDADFFPDDFPLTNPVLDPVAFADEEAEPLAAPAATAAPLPSDEPELDESVSTRVKDAALDGCCPVMLRDSAQLIDGRAEFSHRHQGVVYVFSSREALSRFQEQPERYVPFAGGVDVITVRAGRMEPGSLHFSTWFRNRLYLFSSAEHVTEFRADPLRYVDLK